MSCLYAYLEEEYVHMQASAFVWEEVRLLYNYLIDVCITQLLQDPQCKGGVGKE